ALALHVKVYHGASGPYYYPAYGEDRIWYAESTALYAACGLIFGCCALNQFRSRPTLSFAIRATPLVVALLLLQATSTWDALQANDEFMARYRYNGFAVLELLLLTVMGAAVALVVWREIRETRRQS